MMSAGVPVDDNGGVFGHNIDLVVSAMSAEPHFDLEFGGKFRWPAQWLPPARVPSGSNQSAIASGHRMG